MSIHDGPGIRSTVFLKGCNMKCRWCHNPETWSFYKQLNYIADKCTRCNECISICNYGALSMSPNGLKINRTRCVLCRECIDNCQQEAIYIIGRLIEPQEVMDIILQDKLFFDESGGGVTISGGEPLLQKEFCKEIFNLCRKSKINTAIQTNLTAKWRIIKELLPFIDCWMIDLKIADDTKHKKWTGMSNKGIIMNLKKMDEYNVNIILRTPVIPGINDSESDIRQICDIIKDLKNIIYYELLAFHPLGAAKFENLGMKNDMDKTPFLKKNKLNDLQMIPAEYGININTKAYEPIR